MEYSKEPELFFDQIDKKRYCQLYNIELGTFYEDLPFYRDIITSTDKVLELGAGSGRLTEHLAQKANTIVALDISFDMLVHNKQQKHNGIIYICGDMRTFAFSLIFDKIIIPYNTLNLLSSNGVDECLELCKLHMHMGSSLLIQLHIPQTQDIHTNQKTFQFQIFPTPCGGKVIKETLREYLPQSSTLLLEERYRIRPSLKEGQNEDLNNFMTLYTPTLETWENHFSKAGFSILRSFGTFDYLPYSDNEHTCLLVELKPSY